MANSRRSTEKKMTNDFFEAQIRSMIEAKELTDQELQKLLLNSEAEIVPLNNKYNSSLPTVSIVLPVHNEGKKVVNCLKTLIRQTYPNIVQIIAVDDGSTDDSLKWLKDFMKTYSIVQVIESPHYGSSSAKNLGLEQTTGQIIMFTEADALYAPWYAEKAVDILISNNADAVMLQGSWLLNSSIISKCTLVIDQIKWGRIKTGKRDTDSAWVYKADKIREVKGFNEKIKYGEDKELLERVRTTNGRIEVGLGYNWFHPTQRNLKQYLKRRFNEQRSKTAQFNSKTRTYLLKTFIILSGIFLLISLCYGLELFPSLTKLIIIAPFLLFYIIRLSQLLRVHKNVYYKPYLFFLPLISIITIIPKILGTLFSTRRDELSNKDGS